MTDYVAEGWNYAKEVVDRKIPNGQWAVKACERSLRDRANQNTPAFPYRFDEKKAEKVCKFIENLPHVKGILAGKLIKLESWQCWLICQMFGWIHAGGVRDGLRRFRRAYVEVGRGNAKSTLSSGIALYMLTADAAQSNCFCFATTREQARLVWADARAMADSAVPQTRMMMDTLGVETHAHAISVQRTNSSFVNVSAEARTLDGLNISFAVADELHAHPTRALWDVMVTGCGKRENSLLLAISTAGTDMAGICYENHEYLEKILDEVAEDESQFGCIWAADDDDPFELPGIWVKANPNLNISVDPSHLEGEARKAAVIPAAQNNFRTKHLCQWVSANSAFFDMTMFKAIGDTSLKLSDFVGKPCYIGLDLASVSDLAAKTYMFPERIGDEIHYTMFSTSYLSEATIKSGKNSQYQGWAITGELIETPGNVTDLNRIQDDLKDDLQTFKVLEIAFDPFQGRQMILNMQALGYENVIELPSNTMSFSEPMKELDRAMRTGRLKHNGNKVLIWTASNVVCHMNAKDDIYPRKANDNPDNKIDPIVAAIMALARAMFHEADEFVYMAEKRGFSTFG